MPPAKERHKLTTTATTNEDYSLLHFTTESDYYFFPEHSRHATTIIQHIMDLLRVHSQDLHDHIAQEVGECLESGLYTDLAIRCAQGQTLHAHRLVMAAVSPYLQMVIWNFSKASS